MSDGKRGLSPSPATPLDLIEVPGGTRLRLRVKPGARKTAILGVRAGALELSVTAAPEKGKANKAVLRPLAHALDLAPSTLELVSGLGSRDKTVFVPAPATTVLERLAP
jgi:uncharacterized protein YggU (UPF0235/DUF167 family)